MTAEMAMRWDCTVTPDRVNYSDDAYEPSSGRGHSQGGGDNYGNGLAAAWCLSSPDGSGSGFGHYQSIRRDLLLLEPRQ